MRFSFLVLLTFIWSLAAPVQAQRDAGDLSAPPAGNASSIGSSLKQLLGADQSDEFLPPELAFRANASSRGDQTITVDFTPAQDYYLYREKFAFRLEAASGTKIEEIVLPAGKIKKDPIFGTTEVYHQPVQAVLHLQRASPQSEDLTLHATYQGCSEKGLCYPPETKAFKLSLTASGGAAPIEPRSESAQIESLLQGGSLWLVVAAFFGFGLALTFTPCVLPMMPIVSGLIVGQGANATRARSFKLTLAYVMGMAVTYALAGVAAGLSGALISSALQNPWVLGSFALVFVALALSMFGFYELQLPSSVQTRLSGSANRLASGNMVGVAGMGALSALIVSPCVAAPLAGALLYISQTRDVVLGGSALFAMALGMGVPLLAIGASAGAFLPKAGPWMEAVKRLFGVLLLAVAIWIVTPVLPESAPPMLWGALLLVVAILLGVFAPVSGKPWPHSLAKALGVVALVGGAFAIVTTAADLLGMRKQHPGTLLSGNKPGEVPVAFARVADAAQLDAQLRAANGRVVMLDFYADWCVSCKEMERYTFRDPQVRTRLDKMVLLQADVTRNSPADKALLQRYGVFGPPAILFFDAQGQEVRARRVYGYQPAEQFLTGLQQVCTYAAEQQGQAC